MVPTLYEQADRFIADGMKPAEAARRLGIRPNALAKRKQAAAKRATLLAAGEQLRGRGRPAKLGSKNAAKAVAMVAANGKTRAKDVVAMLKEQESVSVSVSTVLRALRDRERVPDSVMFFHDEGDSLRKILAAFDDTLQAIDICMYVFTNEAVSEWMYMQFDATHTQIWLTFTTILCLNRLQKPSWPRKNTT
jgi:transposase